MNAAGMLVALREVYGTLGMPFYQSIVTDGSVSLSEFYGTHQHLAGVISTLATPSEKLEALVAEHNEKLPAQLDKFNAIGQQDFIGGFRTAQTMVGYVTTIMNKSGIRG
jgi:hypothetical protein